MDWHFSGTYIVVDPLFWGALAAVLAAVLAAAGIAVFLVTRSRKPGTPLRRDARGGGGSGRRRRSRCG